MALAVPVWARQCLVSLKGTKTITITAEIADTPAAREKGLMARKKMPLDRGMLFVFEAEGVYSFWMKNTFLPLTIIFIDAQRRIAGIQDMTPQDETLHQPDRPYMYALELNQHIAERAGLKSGDTVTILGDLTVKKKKGKRQIP